MHAATCTMGKATGDTYGRARSKDKSVRNQGLADSGCEQLSVSSTWPSSSNGICIGRKCRVWILQKKLSHSEKSKYFLVVLKIITIY